MTSTLTALKVDDPVWYWARCKGERPHKKHGILTEIDKTGKFARVNVYSPTIAVPVQIVELKRLNFDYIS